MVAKAVACNCWFCEVSRVVRDYAKKEFNEAAASVMEENGLEDDAASRGKMSSELASIVEAAVGVVLHEITNQLKYSIATGAIPDADGNPSEASMNAFRGSVIAVVSGWSEILEEDLNPIIAGIQSIDSNTGV